MFSAPDSGATGRSMPACYRRAGPKLNGVKLVDCRVSLRRNVRPAFSAAPASGGSPPRCLSRLDCGELQRSSARWADTAPLAILGDASLPSGKKRPCCLGHQEGGAQLRLLNSTRYSGGPPASTEGSTAVAYFSKFVRKRCASFFDAASNAEVSRHDNRGCSISCGTPLHAVTTSRPIIGSRTTDAVCSSPEWMPSMMARVNRSGMRLPVP